MGDGMQQVLSNPYFIGHLVSSLPLWGILILAIMSLIAIHKDVKITSAETQHEIRLEGLKTREHAEKQRLKDRIRELENKLNGNQNT